MALPFIPSAFRKILIVGALCLLFFPLLFSYLVNRWFAQNETAILAYLNESFQVSVKADRIHYGLLKGILIEEVVLPAEAGSILASPLRVKRIRIRPSFSFFPRPGIRLGRVVLEEPAFSLNADVSSVARIGRLLGASPKPERRFGPFYLSMHLSSFEILRGQATLHSFSPLRPWRQEFENIQFFLGRKLWGGERLEFGGHIAGNPKASFRIRATLKNPLPDATHMDLIFDCRQFATAYLKPHLGETYELPDEELTALIHLKIRKGKTFVSKGKVSLQGVTKGEHVLSRLISLVSSSFKYEVRGEMEGERCLLKKLVFKTAGVALKGGGEVRFSEKASAYTLSLVSKKTSARKFEKIFPNLRIASGNVQLFFGFTGSSKRFSPSLDLVLENCSFYDKKRMLSWSKMDGWIRLSKERVVVDEVWAFLNNFPIRIRGALSHMDHPRLQLEVSTYPGQVSILRPKNPLNAAGRFIGEYDGRRWNGDLWLTHFLYQGQKQEEEKWKVALHGLTAEGFLPHQVQSHSFSVRREGSKRMFDHLAMRRASFFISGEPDRIRCDLLEGSFGRGKLFLQSWLDLQHFPNLSWTVNGSLSEGDITFLLDRFEKQYPVTGRLFAEGSWSRQKNSSQLLGRFRLVEGVMGPSVPLQRLADETGIEPLRQIQFHEFSGHVAFREGDLDLDNLKILSDQAELLANVKVRGEHLTGTLSAQFPASSVRKSSDLRGLLRYVGEKEHVNFDFRIAGSLGVPRIQWLSGEFKRKVEAKLAPWMRKQLAKEMERILSGRKGGGEAE